MFTKCAPLSRSGYSSSFAFMTEVISNFIDEFADCPPCFDFSALYKELGVIGGAFHEIKPSASRDFEVAQLLLGNAWLVRIIYQHSCEAEIDLRFAKQNWNFLVF